MVNNNNWVDDFDGADIYCPVCARSIRPENVAEVAAGDHDGFIYVHDDIEHDDNDLSALNNGIQ